MEQQEGFVLGESKVDVDRIESDAELFVAGAVMAFFLFVYLLAGAYRGWRDKRG